MATGEFHTYIAGPMSGIPEFNFPAFYAKAAEERAKGYSVINPAELDDEAEEGLDMPWNFYLRRDLRVLADCDRIVLLPGWQKSKGARLERHIGEELGFEIVYPDGDRDDFIGTQDDFASYGEVRS